jgi:lysyl-tRNA synthetase, class II
LSPATASGDVVGVTGRVMFVRNTGKLCFATLVVGTVGPMRFRRGRRSSTSVRMAAKAQRPLPVTHKELNEETRIRQR